MDTTQAYVQRILNDRLAGLTTRKAGLNEQLEVIKGQEAEVEQALGEVEAEIKTVNDNLKGLK